MSIVPVQSNNEIGISKAKTLNITETNSCRDQVSKNTFCETENKIIHVCMKNMYQWLRYFNEDMRSQNRNVLIFLPYVTQKLNFIN